MRPPPLPVVPEGRQILPAPPEPAIGVVAWNMNTTCNYRCSYCTQRFVDDRTRWAADVDRFLDGFGKLPGRWEVKLSGGEPFLHPRFLDVVHGLRERGFLVGVVTNLSASVEKIDAFLDAAGDALTVLSCSLHLEYVDDLTAFIDKCAFAAARMQGAAPTWRGEAAGPRVATATPRAVDEVRGVGPGAAGVATPTRPAAREREGPRRSPFDPAQRGSVVVTTVATRAALPRLRALRERFVEAGIAFKVQPEKQGGVVVDYAPGDVEELVQLGGHNGLGKVAHDFLGQPCWSGSRALIVDDRGEVWRCYPARRHKTERLGNLLDGTLALLPGPVPCRYAYCNCTVPIARGMMPVSAAQDRFAPEDDP